jgi:putative DNA primase/helicase
MTSLVEGGIAHRNGAAGLNGDGGQPGDMSAMLRKMADEAEVSPPPKNIGGGKTGEDIEAILLNAEVDDDGNAKCVLALYPGRFLWSGAYGWLYYRDGYWDTENADAMVDQAVVETMRRRVIAAFNAGKDGNGERIWKFCSANANRVNGAKSLLEHHVAVRTDQFDTHKDLLNVTNGVVDLRTGELKPHSPDYYFMSTAAVAYKPNADSDIWVRWLDNNVGGGEDTANWLQMAVGYTLTGHTYEDILFYLFGPGRSGKGTFTSMMQGIMGHRLAKSTSFETFTAKRDADAQGFAFAPLQTARMVIASETEKNQRLTSARVKTITGGDEISCSYKGRDHFSYLPMYKIWLSSNYAVNADPDDDALWGRIRVIEFPNGHIGNEDRSVKRGMLTPKVFEGVLAWAVQGAIKWYGLDEHGLPELATGAAAKAEQRDMQDSVGQWLSECAVLGETMATPSSKLYKSYEFWCGENGFEPKQQKGVAQSLLKHGCVIPTQPKWHDGKVQRVVLGIGLLQE